MIRRVLQLLLLPLFIPLRLVYADILRMQNATILYSWYRNKKEYEATSIGDDSPEGNKSWEQWQEDAKAMEDRCNKQKQTFIKVIIRPEPLRRWLKANQLANSSESRERYIQEVYQVACARGIELNSTQKPKPR